MDITRKRFVGYLDIMGFKNIICRTVHKDLLEKMCRFESIINNLNYIQNKDEIKNRYPNVSIKSVLFSDSITLISSDDSANSADLITMASIYLVKECLNVGLPINGAISLGEFSADFEKSILVGKPLVDSYLLQSSLLLYGIVLDHNVERFLRQRSHSFPYREVRNKECMVNQVSYKLKSEKKYCSDTRGLVQQREYSMQGSG